MAGVMVSASTGAMNSLLGKLSTLLEKEYTKHKNVQRDVLFLRNELSAMNAVLLKYGDMENPDVQLKAWMKEVRELAYDIEDCIDAFIIRVEHKPDEPADIKAVFLKHVRKLKKWISRHSIARELEDLKQLVVEASERRARYKLDELTSTTSAVAIDPRLPALYAKASELVGIDAQGTRSSSCWRGRVAWGSNSRWYPSWDLEAWAKQLLPTRRTKK